MESFQVRCFVIFFYSLEKKDGSPYPPFQVSLPFHGMSLQVWENFFTVAYFSCTQEYFFCVTIIHITQCYVNTMNPSIDMILVPNICCTNKIRGGINIFCPTSRIALLKSFFVLQKETYSFERSMIYLHDCNLLVMSLGSLLRR